MLKLRLACLGFALVALTAVGCGENAVGEEERVTKGEFIKKADVLCEEADKAQEDAQRAFEQTFPEPSSGTLWQEKLVLDVGLPPVQTLAEELNELAAPSGDEEEISAIVQGMERAVDEASANPSSMLEEGSVGPFTQVLKLAKEYGFKACSAPI